MACTTFESIAKSSARFYFLQLMMIYTLPFRSILATFKVLRGLWEPATCVSQSINENCKKSNFEKLWMILSHAFRLTSLLSSTAYFVICYKVIFFVASSTCVNIQQVKVHSFSCMCHFGFWQWVCYWSNFRNATLRIFCR